jgi:hypothetical protein
MKMSFWRFNRQKVPAPSSLQEQTAAKDHPQKNPADF